jgi:hypothetical protein
MLLEDGNILRHHYAEHYAIENAARQAAWQTVAAAVVDILPACAQLASYTSFPPRACSSSRRRGKKICFAKKREGEEGVEEPHARRRGRAPRL